MDGTFQSGQVLHTACLTAGSLTKTVHTEALEGRRKNAKDFANGGRAGSKENARLDILVASLYNVISLPLLQ
jgi:hypothetical protein